MFLSAIQTISEIKNPISSEREIHIMQKL